MPGTTRLSNERLNTVILEFSRHIAGPCRITASCILSDYVSGLPSTRRISRVVVVIHDFPSRLMNYVKNFDGANVAILAVDQWIFERDVDRGFLGEALAGGLIFPYEPILNPEYLRIQEVKLKKRLVVELMQNLVLDFPELSYELRIKPDYFMYEAMMTRARLFPPMLYSLAEFMREEGRDQRVEKVLEGFLPALQQLEVEGVVTLSNGYVKMCQKFLAGAKGRRIRFTNLLKTGQRALFSSILNIIPQILDFFSQNVDTFSNLQRVLDATSKMRRRIEDPEKYILVPTSRGFAPLANRTSIQTFARKVLKADEHVEVKVQNIGGILNDVYSVRTPVNGYERKVVVKRFRDWSNFKWFPLTLWSVGTRSFSVLASSRLARECAMNQLLDSRGFNVPKVLHVSLAERLLFLEYVEGEELSELVKRIKNSKSTDEFRKDLLVIEKAGELLASVHAVPVALGDTKPENFKISKKGEIYMMDFEQANRNGDKIWDIAEFLYYAGHDMSPFLDGGRIEMIAESFVKGYLRRGGDPKIVRSASAPKYTKVFSLFTFPHIMFILSNVCRHAVKPKEKP